MCEALAKIMEPEITKAKEEAAKAGMEQGIKRGMEQGIKRGMEQGMEQGIAQGIAIAKMVIKLDAQGYNLTEIAEKAGITEQDARFILAQ